MYILKSIISKHPGEAALYERESLTLIKPSKYEISQLQKYFLLIVY